ncbi:MAG: hypothetical protein M3Y54_03150 [Bacteroidota bacterium]|nr:hypothetical protein [Bacteroidota bacterium]
MSTKEQNTGCVKIVLIGAAVGLGWMVLKFFYKAGCYVGANAFLALDASAYCRAGKGAVGYALLGLGLGAACGAIGAQQRFRLNRLVSIGAGALALGLFTFIFVGNTAASAPTVDNQVAEESVTVETAGEPSVDSASVNSSTEYFARPDTASQPASEWMRVVVGVAPLRGNWFDSLAAPLARLKEEDTVHIVRRAHHWALVVGGSPGQQNAPMGWVRMAGLGPLPESEAETETNEPQHQVSAVTTSKAAEATSSQDSVTVEAAVKQPSWPMGHQQHKGQVGKQAATFSIDWQPDGVLSGSYSNDQNPGTIYRLTGAATASGELRLVEFTRGRQSARCVLQLQGETYVGTMTNTDGQQFPMSLEK